jgi:replicative DNA helicase
MNYEKGKHYDVELEMGIIGACLLEADAVARIFGLIKPLHFYDDKNAFLIKHIFFMWDNSIQIDLLTVTITADEEEWKKISTIDMRYYATMTTNAVVSSAHIETWCFYLRQFAGRRMLLKMQMEAGAFDDPVEGALFAKKMIAEIFEVKADDDWETLEEVFTKKLVPHMDMVRGKDVIGITTGFRNVNDMIHGFQPTQLIVIGARPSIGKSAFAEAMVLAAAKDDKCVGVITLEMPNKQVAGRLLSMDSGFEFWRIWRNRLNEDQYQELTWKMSKMTKLKIYFSDQTGINISTLKAKAHKLKKKYGLDILFIDYLQLIDPDSVKGTTREREVAKMSWACKTLAMDLQIPVILLAQLNRGSEATNDKIPRMHNLRESGAIEQDADVVMMLHRNLLLEAELKKQGDFGPYETLLLIEKNRNGSIGELKILFKPEQMLFYEDTSFMIPVIPLNPVPALPVPKISPAIDWYDNDTDDDEEERDTNPF